MNLGELNARIRTLPPADQEEARYLRDERLGILCGVLDPTLEHVQIVADQLFPAQKAIDSLKMG